MSINKKILKKIRDSNLNSYIENFLKDILSFELQHYEEARPNYSEKYEELINESPLKTPSSNLLIFYFKIGQLVGFDHKKAETKNISQFLTNLKQVFKKQTVSDLY